MKKYLLTAIFIIFFSALFPMVFSAREYTVPQASTPPVVDGKTTTEYEWYGAYHLFMNYEKGYDWVGCVMGDGTAVTNLVQDRENACKGYDVYIMWYGDPNESGEVLDVQHGGLYFRVVAQDKSRGYSYPDGGGQNAGDCVMLSIDPFYYRATNSDNIFAYAFSYFSSPETKGPPTNYEYNQFKCKVSEYIGVYSASTISADGYDLEFFISWTALNLNDKLPRHKVGAKMGLGIALLDSINQSPFYLAIDYGGGADPFRITPRKLNTMVFGNTVYPPDYVAKGDVTALRTLVDKARGLNKKDYTASTYSTLENVLAEADAITEANTQKEIDAAAAKLQKALDELMSVNATAFDKLTATIASAESLVESDYTPETWQPFYIALEGAKAVNSDSSDGLITAADNSLTAAMLSLLKPGEEHEKADLSALNAVLNSVDFITENDLSPENWQKLQQLVEQAKMLTEESSQYEIDVIVSQINEILVQKIEVVEEEIVPDNTDEERLQQKSSVFVWIFTAVCTLFFVAAAVIVYILIRRKNKKISEEEECKRQEK